MNYLVPIRTVSLANQREHWRKRARRTRAERKAAWFLTPKFQPPAIVTLTRIGPREMDDDNLRGALKAIRDGIAQRAGVDDADPRVDWRYRQRRASEYGVEININPQESK